MRRRSSVLRATVLGLVASSTVALTGAGTAGAHPAPAPQPVSSGPAGTAAASGSVGAPGVGDHYYPLDGNGGLDVLHYDIRTGYDFPSGRLRGTTVLTLRATQDLSRFNLDFLLPVSRVTVDGVRAEHRTARGHELVIHPARAVPAGDTVKVKVKYAGKPGRKSYAGERNWLADRHEVVTMNEPHMAPWWFPSNDHPSDKASFRIAVTVPAEKQAVANGVLVKRKRKGDRTTWIWRATEPMTSYLAFFAAGRFRLQHGRTDGRPWTLAVSQRLSKREQRTSMRMLRRTPRLVALLEKDLGPYPFGSTGGLVTSLSPGFALENQTRPTYPSLGKHDDWLVVHELAHQWFGNSVSLSRWRDIWLNEGAATFMEVRHEEVTGGRSGRAWLADMYRNSRDLDPFWRVRIGDPGPERLFHWAVYTRGGMTMQALRQRVGEDDFWEILRTWLAERADGHGTTEEFEGLAEQISGEDLSGFFDAWLRTPARPARTAENGLL